jgi:hypothetical protein
MKRRKSSLTDAQRLILKAKNESLELSFLDQISNAGIGPPLRQFQFALPRKWEFDFCWINNRVAVEIHGGVDVDGYGLRGRHVRGKGFEDDRRKINMATCLRWRVLEFTRSMMEPRGDEDSEAITMLRLAL